MKKSKSDVEKIVESYLTQIADIYQQFYDTNDIYLEKSNDGAYTLSSKKFMLLYDLNDNHSKFLLTFPVGLDCRTAGNIVKLIDMVLVKDDYIILQDFYVDILSKAIFFGDDAIQQKESTLRQAKGQMKCPICEGIYNKRHFTEDGYCLNCQDIKNEIMWN